ncbi:MULTISPECIES: RdgB/HAM1 family non-canonical purine NTP pyrophosphatase [unclassified Helicobacter]|uniref:RdgB/HAM1 family non-canonical purine NTP pyrophosphatase n=1 Tax=unclassified Helicobacter TaxID=2593540 RepID=UPI0013152946|nr:MULTISPECIES: RdgB/HAM1 family non-canonical purine NTP pyrophosphatase [unclassified Helicobacter]
MQDKVEIIVASSNQGKIQEIQEIFKDFRIISMQKAGLSLDIKEDGQSFLENAIIKAKAVYKALGCASNILVLSDDSGLCVSKLDDEPNIYSARYANWLKGIDSNSSDAENNLALIERMKQKNLTSSPASFVASMVVLGRIRDKEIFLSATEECRGMIYPNQRGDKGFGYDSLFEPLGFDKRMGEMELFEKNSISHRSKALKKINLELEEKLNA